MTEKARKISTTVFLLAVFVFLAVFLGGWLYRVYTTQTTYSTGESKSAITCVGYTFDIDKESLVYEHGVLHFEIAHQYGDQIDVLIVESGTETREVVAGDFIAGVSQLFQVELPLGEEVKIYPKGCRDHNFKLFKIG
ncbi:hypothetical protein ACFL96_06595 [Thermoproteota archaeon]